jgi:hypothetical protein
LKNGSIGSTTQKGFEQIFRAKPLTDRFFPITCRVHRGDGGRLGDWERGKLGRSVLAVSLSFNLEIAIK